MSVPDETCWSAQMWFALAFLAWPLIEIALFVTVGGAIGLWATLGIIFGTGVLGVFVLRRAARMTGSAGLRDPRQMVLLAARGGMNLLAGGLLILPGFLTDVMGLCLLLPPVQAVASGLLAARIKVPVRPRDARDDVVEGSFERVDTDADRAPSKWTEG